MLSALDKDGHNLLLPPFLSCLTLASFLPTNPSIPESCSGHLLFVVSSFTVSPPLHPRLLLLPPSLLWFFFPADLHSCSALYLYACGLIWPVCCCCWVESLLVMVGLSRSMGVVRWQGGDGGLLKKKSNTALPFVKPLCVIFALSPLAVYLSLPNLPLSCPEGPAMTEWAILKTNLNAGRYWWHKLTKKKKKLLFCLRKCF